MLGSCLNRPDNEGDPILAKVYEAELKESEVSSSLTQATGKLDSQSIVNRFIDNWVKDQLLIREAKLSQPADSDIDRLVEDYRSSLLMHQYERLLVETTLDSTITPSERMQYYQNHMDDFILQEDIYRCFFVKIGLNHPEKDSFNDLWSDLVKEEFSKLTAWCDSNETICLSDTSAWYPGLTLSRTVFPEGHNFRLNSRGKQTYSDTEHQYLLWIYDKKEQGEISPFDHISEQIKRVILFKRKNNLLKKKRTELYKRESDKKNIKIYFE